MTELDFETFGVAFDRMVTGFRLKLKAKEAKDLPRIYFRALSAFPLDAVLVAGKVCVDTGRKFPQVADWLDVVSRATPETHSNPTAARYMSADELDAYERAAALGFTDLPCDCLDCQAAQVTSRDRRFVPTVVGDGYEHAFNSRRNKLELVGHWAHGDELRRWYDARARFFALAQKAPYRVLRLLTAAREPGMEG